ncbi:DNA replication/repair protein RecF [Thiolapillus sp.]
MKITRIQIQNLRIIEDMQLEPGAGLNFICGDNGAGKTSVLEAIFLLGQGKSFRHTEAGPLIRKGEEYARVVADLQTQSGKRTKLGIQRSNKQFLARNAGQDVSRRSELLRLLPLQFITPQSHELIEKGPELRRRYLDFGLFHVEHSYHQTLSAYQRALKQRNAALRSRNAKLAQSFDEQLVSFADLILESRCRLLASVTQYLQDFLEAIDFPIAVDLRLTKGWKNDISLSEALCRSKEQDLSKGFTHVGAHRAQLKILADNVLANRILSRGQQKLLVYGLVMAISQLIADKTSEKPLLLIDDLGAELDESNTGKLLNYLHALGAQVFITLLHESDVQQDHQNKVFHVKHGSTWNT